VREIERRAVAAYRTRFGAAPEVVASAPGRVNLIGEHTDYNGGYVLPIAINRRTAVALGRGDGPLYSADFDDARPRTGAREGAWVDYPRGVAWALGQAGMIVPAFQAAFAGEVPQGAGLSSSAAIEAATILALDALGALGLARTEMARLCQRAENAFVGVRSGIMDQYASLLGQQGHALLVDCRSLASEAVPLDLASAGLSLLVCDTGVKRGLAATGYNDRRATCERAAAQLGVAQLRDATEADLARLSGEELLRARHVVTENARVLAAVATVCERDFATFGALMYASHASLRDDFAVSTPELDAVVAAAHQTGALGARLTGAGFGGCAIALVADPAALEDLITRTFAARGYHTPTCYVFSPAAGAEVITDGTD
jgi:galactokinase